MKVEFCLPVYNEACILEANAKKLLEYCLRADFPFEWKVLFLINGSTDESLSIARAIKAELPSLVEVVESKEKGRGLAIKRYWRESRADIVSYMDVDLAVSLDDIKGLIGALIDEGFDLAIGSRLLPESKIKRSFWREFVSHSYIYLSRLLLGHRFSDLQCGFKAVRQDKFAFLADFLISKKWFFDTELIVFASRFGFKIKEIPVRWEENRYDQRRSKVNVLRDSLRFLADVIGLRWRLLRQKRLK